MHNSQEAEPMSGYKSVLSDELLKDLFWDLGQLYYRYDSDPSEFAASKSDWGIVSGLRYKYN